MSTIEKALKNLGSSTQSAEGGSQKNDIERAETARAKAKVSKPEAKVESEDIAINRPVEQSSSQTMLKKAVEIPFDSLHQKGFLTPAIPRSTIAEEFRAIKRPLLKNIAGKSAAPIKNANLIMVTSALEGDGKTFSSLNLAMSIAMEQDKTVLYVDADVLKATAGGLLGVSHDTPGLIDLLRKNDVRPEDVILRTNIENLRLLPAGAPDEHATELLASENMHKLMLELSDRYFDRVIVFDSPPLLLTTESGVLASSMGQIVFVVAADITPQRAVDEALEHIGSDKMVGVMLNRASPRRAIFGKGYGGYGYGYGYGSARLKSPGDPVE